MAERLSRTAQAKDATKNLLRRAEFWLILWLLGILGDEYIKEGYFFNFAEIIEGGFTHEKIFVVSLAALVILAISDRRKRNEVKSGIL